jgi:hypothetical protein
VAHGEGPLNVGRVDGLGLGEVDQVIQVESRKIRKAAGKQLSCCLCEVAQFSLQQCSEKATFFNKNKAVKQSNLSQDLQEQLRLANPL